MIKSLYLVTNQPVTPMKACAIVLIAALGILSAAGKNHFDLALSSAGVYSIVLETARGKISTKVVCTAALTGTDQITSAGEVSGPMVTKAAKSGYSLGFLENDRIHFRCTSGQMTAMVLESPRESGRVTVEFAACIDGSGVHYPVIKIGDQKWMAKNLAYLPSVSHPDTNSDTEKLYYVYGYEGTDVMEAKATENYGTYGVLYNWPAAGFTTPTTISGLGIPSGFQPFRSAA